MEIMNDASLMMRKVSDRCPIHKRSGPGKVDICLLRQRILWRVCGAHPLASPSQTGGMSMDRDHIGDANEMVEIDPS